jgi:hypothetical protein
VSRTARIVIALLIAATLAGGYLIASRRGPQAPGPGDAAAGFVH